MCGGFDNYLGTCDKGLVCNERGNANSISTGGRCVKEEPIYKGKFSILFSWSEPCWQNDPSEKGQLVLTKQLLRSFFISYRQFVGDFPQCAIESNDTRRPCWERVSINTPLVIPTVIQSLEGLYWPARPPINFAKRFVLKEKLCSIITP